MMQTFASPAEWATVTYHLRRQTFYRRLWLLIVLGLATMTAGGMLLLGPTPLPIGVGLFLATVAVIYAQPRYGLYFVIFFALLGDAVLLPAYPFVKNLSSVESLLYVHDALIFSPLELYLVITLVLWLGKAMMQRNLTFHTGVLFWPTLCFTLLQIGGLVYGLGTGGDINVALWESRVIFYLPILFVLTSNLIEERAHVMQLIWIIMGAILLEGLVGIGVFMVRHHGSLAGVESITEHSAAIHMNTLFVLLFASWLFGADLSKRMGLLLMAPPVLITYIITQRRAAFVGLGLIVCMMAVIFYRLHRRLFWIVMPILAVLGMLYLAAFWNSGSALGFLARAVKSVVAPDAGSADESSNLYRILENINIAGTIYDAPFTGVGYGQKFHILVPMPDISFFVWWEYIVHNSIFWIWLKSGLLGFLAVLFLAGFSIMRSAAGVWLMPDRDLRAVAFTIAAYLLMHFVYAYVDMSWDAQSMLYVGTALGLVGVLERLVPVGASPPSDLLSRPKQPQEQRRHA